MTGHRSDPAGPPAAPQPEGRLVDGRLVALALALLALVMVFGMLVLHSD